ncbi:ABC1-domain-containing protein, partial [Lactarius hatsudake]
RTAPFIRTTPPSNSFVRHLGRWPFRRSGSPPPLRPLGVGASTRSRVAAYSIAITFGVGIGFIAYENHQPFRHTVLAVIRCSRVAGAAILGAIDYKRTFARTYASDEERLEAYSECHLRSANRVLRALLANGGVFIKLGQHVASIVVLPLEWRSTMRPLQDKCDPTPYEDVNTLFVSDMGRPLSEIFDYFNPDPIGVASLAQVHIAHHRETGKTVAVKLQHPHLLEFSEIDMEMVELTLGWIKRWFPEFEFTWLGEEMRENLPKELDFTNEARNARMAFDNFKSSKTSLYIPEVISADKRVLIMEFIEGARVDDLEYLAAHNIDRNKVSLELSRIFSQMVYLDGWFHAIAYSVHSKGNLLIRPRPAASRSPYNFEIVLLDHGLYFDLDRTLRINYSKLWKCWPRPGIFSYSIRSVGGRLLLAQYPIFEAALTGRATMEDAPRRDNENKSSFQRASSMLEQLPQTDQEVEALRNAVMTKEGLLLSVFDILRKVPRRVLMVFKLNDLTRSLDHALATTHSKVRVFVVVAKYCTAAVWEDERQTIFDGMRGSGLLSPGNLTEYFGAWWRFERLYCGLVVLEWYMDIQAQARKFTAWFRGLYRTGFEGAHKAASGLT